MAVTKRSGSRRVPQLSAGASLSASPQPPSKYTRVLESAESLNRAFDQVAKRGHPLEENGLLLGRGLWPVPENVPAVG